MRKAKRSIIYALTVLLSVSVLLVVHRLPILSVNYVYYKFHPEESIFCYAAKESSLVDISEVEPKKGRSIFFHETSCSSLLDGKITINPRQACAVESAAKLHPDHEVYLLFTSPGTFAKGDDNHIIDALRKYENVKLLHVNFTRYVEGTKVQLLYENGQLPYSNYARSHASDVLRYLTLHKYGGIYLDLDVVVIKPLNGLGENFAGAESRRNVAAGVLGFASSGPGHQLVDMCLDDLSKNFDGWNWGNNGPGVITRLAKKLCESQSIHEALGKDCGAFKLYPKEAFYPIEWTNWTMYFDENLTDHVLKRCENSYTIHVWNQFSSSRKLPVDAEVPYTIFAKKFCPNVFKSCGKYF